MVFNLCHLSSILKEILVKIGCKVLLERYIPSILYGIFFVNNIWE